MSKVFSALAVSADGFISGGTPGGQEEFGRGLGDAPELFDWYFRGGNSPSRIYNGFALSAPSARFFDSIADRVGVAVTGWTTYEHSSYFGGTGPHPDVPLVVVSHGPRPQVSENQTLVTTGIEDAIAIARTKAGAKDVSLMGGVLTTEAIKAGLVDELILHQVPVLLGHGHRFFSELQEKVPLRLVEVVSAPEVTHIHYEVVR
ncbi:MAG TPA: dihydrofolate reductase family protein [Galbitalea sp.]|nr:dihydrofolate reductase family protein [Galbitalea sp.]